MIQKNLIIIFLFVLLLGSLEADTFHQLLRERRICYPCDAFPLFTERTDKLLAKEYILSHNLEVLKVPEVYYVTKKPKSIPFHTLPDRFVIKANHGTRMNIFCKNKKKFNELSAIKSCEKYLRHCHAQKNGENWYFGIDRKIFVEEYIEDLIDLKFHCIYGKVAFIEY